MRAGWFSIRSARTASRFVLSRQTRRFARDRRGATAVEFAFIAVPFLGMLLTIVESGRWLFTQHALDLALQDAARRIMTGEVQVGGLNAAQFKADICARMTNLVDCATGVKVDVKSYTAAAPAPIKPPVVGGAMDTTDFGFNPGGPNCIVVVRAAVQYSDPLQSLGSAMNMWKPGERLLMSSVSFRNEPYVFNGTPPGCSAAPGP